MKCASICLLKSILPGITVKTCRLDGVHQRLLSIYIATPNWTIRPRPTLLSICPFNIPKQMFYRTTAILQLLLHQRTTPSWRQFWVVRSRPQAFARPSTSSPKLPCFHTSLSFLLCLFTRSHLVPEYKRRVSSSSAYSSLFPCPSLRFFLHRYSTSLTNSLSPISCSLSFSHIRTHLHLTSIPLPLRSNQPGHVVSLIPCWSAILLARSIIFHRVPF